MSLKLRVTSPKYGGQLVEAGILCAKEIAKDPPSNFDEILNSLGKPRNDPVILEDELESYRRRLYKAHRANESYLIQSVLPELFEFKKLHDDYILEFQVGTRWTTQEIFSDELGQPQPDQTLGLAYSYKGNRYPHTISDARDYSNQLQPCKDLLCPMLTVEVKGPGGTMQEAMFQNRHNGACMVRNLAKLKLVLGQQATEYCQRAQVLTIEISHERVQVSCHWTDGNDRYLSQPLAAVQLYDLGIARQLVRNAIEWTERELRDLDAVLFQPLEERGSKRAGRPPYNGRVNRVKRT